MVHRRIQACIYEGTHNPIEDPFRYPVQLPVRSRMEEPPSRPLPIPYYTIRRCRACGMEEHVPYNFTPRAALEVRGDL